MINLKKEIFSEFNTEFRNQVSKKYPGIKANDYALIYDKENEIITEIRIENSALPFKSNIETIAYTISQLEWAAAPKNRYNIELPLNPLAHKPVLSAMDRCDEILKFLYASYNKSQPYGRIEECFVYDYEGVNKNEDYSTEILEHILYHLKHEEYIYKDQHKVNYESGGHKITEDFQLALSISGEVFISRGGYKGLFERENQEKTRIKELEEAETKRGDQIVSLTRALVWLTGVLGLGALVEVLKYLHIHPFYY